MSKKRTYWTTRRGRCKHEVSDCPALRGHLPYIAEGKELNRPTCKRCAGVK